MRCAALLLVALLVAVRAEGAPRVEDEYQEAMRNTRRKTECEDCPRCPPHPANCTFLISSGDNFNYFYNVDGVKLKIESNNWKWSMKLTCAPGVKLDSASLPVFPTLKGFFVVTLTACPAPRASGGIGRVLSRLNITKELDELYMNDVPPAPPLQPDLFAGLQNLHSLHLSAEAGLVLEPPPGLLKPTMKLLHLDLTDVKMSPAVLARLPPNLYSLDLVQRPPAEGSAPALPSTDLENDILTCSQLQLFSVSSPRGTVVLPAGWLQVRGEARCPQLKELRLYSCELGGLPADALRGLTELAVLRVMDCRELRTLTDGLFRDTRLLRQLFLENNALEVLPKDIFKPLLELEELDLSGNKLGALGDGAAALVGLRSLTSLQVLVLDHNPLGDTCGHSSRDATLNDYELSPLRYLRALRKLSLAHTGASRLCEDWGHDLHALKRIDLSYNNLTEVKWNGRGREVDKLELRLAGAHLASLPDAPPASLSLLDLRNASLPAATQRQVDALYATGFNVILNAARVACACVGGAQPLLMRVLVKNFEIVQCAEDGRLIYDALPCKQVAEPGLLATLAGALGVLAVVTLVLTGARFAARRGSRLCAAWTRRNDDGDDSTSVHYRNPESRV